MGHDVAQLKQEAAEKAVDFVQSGMVVGLGTGSTAVYATRRIGELLKDGRLANIIAIPTSNKTAQQAKEAGIPLTTLDAHPQIDLTIDGADEVAPNLDLIKGLGGALLREKIVAAASKTVIIVADDSKRVQQLGSKAPIPVEVIPFAERPVFQFLSTLCARVEKRGKDERTDPFKTDEDNIILDCHFDEGIVDAPSLAWVIKQQPGVVEHGLFLNLASRAVIASEDGVTVLESK